LSQIYKGIVISSDIDSGREEVSTWEHMKTQLKLSSKKMKTKFKLKNGAKVI